MNKRTNQKSISPSRQEQIDIMKSTNEVALYLYNYYVSVASVQHRDLLDDKSVGAAIGWTARKVKDNRLKLTHKGWIYFTRKTVGGVKFSTWVFGRNTVEDFKVGAIDVPESIKSEVIYGDNND